MRKNQTILELKNEYRDKLLTELDKHLFRSSSYCIAELEEHELVIENLETLFALYSTIKRVRGYIND